MGGGLGLGLELYGWRGDLCVCDNTIRQKKNPQRTLARALDAIAYSNGLAVPMLLEFFFARSGIGIVLEIGHGGGVWM